MKITTYMQRLGLLAALQLSFGSAASWAEETPAVPAAAPAVVEQTTTDSAVAQETTKTLAKSGLPAEKLVLSDYIKEKKALSYGEVNEWHIQRTHNTAAKVTVILAPKALELKSIRNGRVIKGEKLAKITGNTNIDPNQKYVATACRGCQKGQVLVERCMKPEYFSVILNMKDLPALAEGKTQDLILKARQKKLGSSAFEFYLETAESDIIVKQQSRQADRHNDVISFTLLASNSKKGSKASERLEGKNKSERTDKESKKSKHSPECLDESVAVDINNDGEIDESEKKVAQEKDSKNKSSGKQKRKDLPRYCLDQEQAIITNSDLDNDNDNDDNNNNTATPGTESEDTKLLAAFESEHQKFVQDHLLK